MIVTEIYEGWGGYGETNVWGFSENYGEVGEVYGYYGPESVESFTILMIEKTECTEYGSELTWKSERRGQSSIEDGSGKVARVGVMMHE